VTLLCLALGAVVGVVLAVLAMASALVLVPLGLLWLTVVAPRTGWRRFRSRVAWRA
jgi:hypothetical protein